MKNLLIVLFVFTIFTVSQAFAYNLNSFSNDSKILSALNLLEQSGEYQVFENLKKNGVKIKFYNFTEMGYGQNVYAASTYDSFGNRVIYVNTLYKDAPVEQIACLIAHESCHVLRKSNLEEETVATQKEATCWIKFKNNSITYPQTRLTKRLDKLAGLYNSSDSHTNKIQNKIASSGFYQFQYGM